MRLFFALSISAAFFSCHPVKKVTNTTIESYNPIVAHRGAWKKNNLPENSLASLRQAIKLQCAGSEFDVRMTSDDSLVINHDPTFHHLEIEKSTFAALQTSKLSNGEDLPTLREYLKVGQINNRKTSLVCEIKPSDISKERGKLIADKVVTLVRELSGQAEVVYISFDYDILRRIHELIPGAVTQYLRGDKSPEQLRQDGIAGADYHFSVFKDHPDWIQSARENKIVLNAWTVNEVADMDWLIANDFDFITTNEPELLAERIKKASVRKRP